MGPLIFWRGKQIARVIKFIFLSCKGDVMKTVILMLSFLFCLCSNVSAEWIVTWEVVDRVMVPCSQQSPEPDEYGRQPNYAMTLAACWETFTSSHNRSFATLEEAEAFVRGGKKSGGCEGFLDSYLQNFSIQEKGDQ